MNSQLPHRIARKVGKHPYRILERSYRYGNSALRSFFLSITAATLILMAYSMFGEGIDREKLTSKVTPVHIQLSTISGERQTAENFHNLQL